MKFATTAKLYQEVFFLCVCLY